MSSSPLSIAVLGVGNIGSTYAYYLSRAGHTVTAIARPNSTRLTQLTTTQHITLDTNNQQAAITPTDHLDPHTSYDLLLVCLVDHQVEPLLPVLQQSTAKAVLLMFNTYRPEQLVAALGGAERCTLGMPFVQASLDGDGRLHCTTNRGRSLLGDRRWVDLFNSAELPATYEPQMSLWLRNHASFCVAFESIAVLAKRSGGGASWAQARSVARGMQQGLELTRQLGYPIYGQGKGMFYRAPAAVPAFVLWSLSRVKDFRELLALGEVECRAMCDAMIAQAAAAQPAIPVPALKAIRSAIQH